LATTGQFPYAVSIIENAAISAADSFTATGGSSPQRPVLRGMIQAAMANNTTTKIIKTRPFFGFSKLPSALRIAAGSLGWNQEPDVQSVPVYNVYVFDGYNSTFQLNDIALLKVIHSWGITRLKSTIINIFFFLQFVS
jgi:hypothetical protein